jgi:hypothetical protein
MVILVFMNGSCIPMDRAWIIYIINNSPQAIYAYANYILPDTVLPTVKPFLIQVPNGKITIGSIYDEDVGDPEFKRLKKDRLTVFILSKDTVDKYAWDIVRDKYMILKRYEFNAKELTEMGGEIVYP